VSGGDQAVDFIYLMLVLVLVGSALMVRRIPLGQGLKMFAGWVLIFLAAFVAFTLKDDFIDLGKRVVEETRGGGTVAAQAGETLRIKQSLDGHFWVDGTLNGEKVRFLIDSGATTTSISTDTARRAGIEPSSGIRRWSGPPTEPSRSNAAARRRSKSVRSSANASRFTSRKRSATWTCSA
jgi:aspartyl protease family protein